MKQYEVTFFVDDIAEIVVYKNYTLVSRKIVKANTALVWMNRQDRKWYWGYDQDGNEIAKSE